MAGKQMVANLIKQKKVVMISKTYCPFCTKAKNALANYKINPEEYEILEIEDRNDMDEIQNYMSEITGARSVPRVFIGGKFYGGGDEMMNMHRSKKLEPVLSNAGALL
ncbi:glutaredoxin [Eurytemora carolleeae]|uniref:glutaredoxin n=1 Tax=Eurytemora carolleeae TaxID=1294199 RepID=UPI000C75ABB6|nr:glutaredoxin [Eurytemora carolleeae]|eukprot:XP_023337993.1 glutaredoxin-like [Eurytemora affinis]